MALQIGTLPLQLCLFLLHHEHEGAFFIDFYVGVLPWVTDIGNSSLNVAGLCGKWLTV